MGKKLKNIFNSPSQFRIVDYIHLSKKIENPSAYYSKLEKVITKIKEQFPLLKYCNVPLYKPKTSFLYGILLPIDTINFLFLTKDDYEKFGLTVFVEIPEDFETRGLKVYDCCKVINWNNIELKYTHFRNKETSLLCTHHPKDITKKNCVINVLMSAFYLIQEYKKYELTGKFDLKCLPHGELNAS